MHLDPIFRKYDHNLVTFRPLYTFSENFLLPLSHDEVVHGKGSLLNKMPGSDWDKFANLRLLLGYMYAQPGKKLLFMGGEFGQWREWNHDSSIDWHLLAYPAHAGLQRWVQDLNRLYVTTPALHEGDCDPAGFAWVDCNDAASSILCFVRQGHSDPTTVLIACNFTPVPRSPYRVGVPYDGVWREVLNSDAHAYGGQGFGNMGAVEAAPIPHHGRPYSLELTLPPLGIIFFISPET
jgi:1,4-alpha-glucan branching enzyme